ncbi:MAG: DMT family transporter [Alphaproteobacteria bacterium]|nr:DMT family transporter [Alphaproteobacteria bacterium]
MITQFRKSVLAILYMVGGILLLSLSSAIIRLLSSSYPINQIVIFRTIFGLVVVILFSWLILKQNFWRTQQPMLHFWRSILGIFAMGAYFISLYLLPLADVAALTMTDAIFIALLSSYFLKEKNDYRYWLVIFLGFAGVVIIARPGFSVFNPASLIAVFVGFLTAISMMVISKMAKTETFGCINFYCWLVLLFVSVGLIPWQWWTSESFFVKQGYIGWQPIGTTDWLLLIATSLCTAISNLLITQSYRMGRASLVSPFGYLDLPFSALLGFLWLQEKIDIFLVVGGAAIILSGLGLIYWEKQRDAKELEDKEPQEALQQSPAS